MYVYIYMFKDTHTHICNCVYMVCRNGGKAHQLFVYHYTKLQTSSPYCNIDSLLGSAHILMSK